MHDHQKFMFWVKWNKTFSFDSHKIA